MKFAFLSFVLAFATLTCSYGQISLYNTRTLYDSFENPSQKAFYADSSRRYAFNFLIPTVSLSGNIDGEATGTIKKLLIENKFDAQNLTLGQQKSNRIAITENTYILTYKIFKAVKFHKELGFSWQLRSDTHGDVGNDAIALFQNYRNFGTATYDDPFAINAKQINYHQFSFTYREDWDRRLGLGLKISYLSGIAHTKVKIDSSSLTVNREAQSYNFYLNGKYQSNISWKEDASTKLLLPGLKNPGLALSLSANYKLRGGWSLLGNLKDLGFIRWSKGPYTYTFDDVVSINATSNSNRSRLTSELQKLFDKGSDTKPYTAFINGKADFLLNKDLGIYQPSLYLAKNIFYPGGDIALINRLQYRKIYFSLTADYNLNRYFQAGGQFMFKTPNKEFYIGSDDLFRTYYTGKGIVTNDLVAGKNNYGASVYLGFALKFGRYMQRRQNATVIPGVENMGHPGFFKSLFSKEAKNN